MTAAGLPLVFLIFLLVLVFHREKAGAQENTREIHQCGSFGYTINDDDSATLVEWFGDRDETRLRIPKTLDKHRVSAIGDRAFIDLGFLSDVIFPDSLTSIGTFAFWGTYLERVRIPEHLVVIGEHAFSYCDNLKGFDVSSKNPVFTQTDGVLFDKTKNALHIFPSDREESGYQIPEGTLSVANTAFSWCTSLTSVSFPDSLVSIGDWAFVECTALTSASLPKSLRSIGSNAFGCCHSLAAIRFPLALTYIGECAFYECSSLKRVSITQNVAFIGEGAFALCDALPGFHVSKKNRAYAEADGNLVNKAADTLHCCPALVGGLNYQVSADIKRIGAGAFIQYRLLETVRLPDSLLSIGNRAFLGCEALTSVNLPKSLNHIAESAFDHCPKLTISCEEDSLAMEYAKKKGIPRQSLPHPDEPVTPPYGQARMLIP